MGLFDRFTKKKGGGEGAKAEDAAPEPAPPLASAPVPAPVSVPEAPPAATAALQRLRVARDKLEAREVEAALAIYDEVLAAAGDRADVLVTISGDLGTFGQVRPIIELIAPRYVAERHGPAAGINLLQAYLAVRDPDGAQQMLDVLFALKRPELEERLYGFSNALSDLMLTVSMPTADAPPPTPVQGTPPPTHKGALVSISKPIWFYGLEALAARVLPPKDGPFRRIAFAQLALPGGYPDIGAAMTQPEDELGRLCRAIPAWLSEVFYFTPSYNPILAMALWEEQETRNRVPMLFAEEWGVETLRQLVETNGDGLDYILTGSLRQRSGDYEVNFRLWEVKRFRERKQFLVRWTPGNADAELGRLRQTLCQFMEWKPYPAGVGMTFSPPAAARSWIDGLGASIGLFLAEQGIWPRALLGPIEPIAAELARLAPVSEVASLAWITLAKRCRALQFPAPARPERMFESALVKEAEKL